MHTEVNSTLKEYVMIKIIGAGYVTVNTESDIY